jgi:hypothetical protein
VSKIKGFFLNISDTFRDFKNFLVYPKFEKTRFTLGGFVGVTLIFLVIYFFEFPYGILLGSLYPELETNYIFNGGIEMTFPILIMVNFLGPILEELYFRSWMSNNKWINILLLACAIDFGVSFFVSLFLNETETTAFVDLLIEFANLGLSIFLAHLLINDNKALEGLSNFIKKRSKLLFYLSCICFAVMHISNYTEVPKHIVLLGQLPIFGGALIFGYVRIRFGLFYSMLFHVVHNSFMT